MEGKRHSIKRAGITVMGFVLLISITVVAQEVRSEVSVQGTGFFTKDSNRFWRTAVFLLNGLLLAVGLQLEQRKVVAT
jgi:hypothetical protein